MASGLTPSGWVVEPDVVDEREDLPRLTGAQIAALNARIAAGSNDFPVGTSVIRTDDGMQLMVQGVGTSAVFAVIGLAPALLAASTGATLVGTPEGTVQAALDGRVKTLADYTALRAYTGPVLGVQITSTGIAGTFQLDATDTTSADNGVTVIVDAVGRRFKRLGVVTSINVQWAGVMPGAAYAASNCTAYANLISLVRFIGSNVDIFWPPGEYQFAPKDNAIFSGGAAYAWRNAIELVDVNHVYHRLDGVTIYLRADPAWYRGNSTPVAGLDEGLIQFRATALGACKFVGFYGSAIFRTDETLADTTSSHSDGGAFGVVYRGCQYTHSDSARYEWWGTDGMYFGTDYSNTFSGSFHSVYDPKTYRCYRNGISIVGNDHGNIFGGSLEATQGGSFGHGIDFEPNGSRTQSGWTLHGTATINNQRGACNFINTSDVMWVSPDIDEQYATSNGAIYIDGSNVVGYDVKNIRFDGGIIRSAQPVLYVSGRAAASGGIDNVTFDGSTLSCVGNAPSGNAFLRINAAGNTGLRIGRFLLNNCNIIGNGGIALKSDGTNESHLTIRGGTWVLKNYAGSALSFAISTGTVLDVVDLDGVDMSIAAGMTMATSTPYIVKGSMKNCKFSGLAAAIINWVDYGAGRTSFVIGYNEFSTYNFYKGPVSALDAKIPCTIESPISGDYGLPGRIVFGGRQRILAYATSSTPFTDRQAPRDGDICRNVGNSAASVAETEFTYDGNAARWRVSNWVTKKGTTAARPNPAASPAGYAALVEGITYLDTTLAAAGKPITWNGAAWVDATGATV